MEFGSGQGWWWVACLAACAASWLLVKVAIVYAHRRGMLDSPGQRRSHTMPTPRGGGIGPVFVILPGGTFTLATMVPAYPPGLVASWASAVVLVAAVGWWDDHHDLPAWPRLGVQLAATGMFCAALISAVHISWWWWPVGVLFGVWSINLHNFMDGIDGLLAQQVIFVAIVTAVLAIATGQQAVASLAGLTAAATFGFWLHNRSPASVFMGDVGSGTMGLLIFMFIALVSAGTWRAAWPMLAACSGFLLDAGLTLLWRIARGRRWYTAHREHLYQWLVRCGWTHSRTGRLYMTWNLLTLPFAWMAWRWPGIAPGIVALLYLAGAWLWRRGRLMCLDSVTGRASHGAA